MIDFIIVEMPDKKVNVRLDGKLVGTIKKESGSGFRYYPRGASKGNKGPIFSTLRMCKESLENED